MTIAWGRLGRALLAVLGYGVVVSVLAIPVAVQQAVENVSFEDRLGTLPVEVSLAHNGVSTLDTGILGQLYWDRTGAAGFGAVVRATGPPEAGGTLSSYVSPRFVEANAAFVNDPAEVARIYGDQLRAGLLRHFLVTELAALLVGGLVLAAAFQWGRPFPGLSGRRRLVVLSSCAVGGLVVSTVVAVVALRDWQKEDEVTLAYPMPGIEQLSFSSPETLEVASQVQPFIEKNTSRTAQDARRYEEASVASLLEELPGRAASLQPRAGERIVLAEADPQGSIVGTRVRRVLYVLLEDELGRDSFALRTISGDISSNGTVAEAGFVRGEATASRRIPTVAVKGDHDSQDTVDQLRSEDVVVPDLETREVGGVRVTGANDPAFKTLFGGMVTNDSGITETELGEMLRESLEPDEPVVALVHQPRSAAGFLDVPSLEELSDSEVGRTVPQDDDIPDVPPGILNIGHLHDVDGPWVVWNTDGDEVTWTVVNQLGTSGGVEESPTFNRFSTPFSPPLKTLSVQLQYVNVESGLQTGYASIDIATDGTATVTDRVDLGLPGGLPRPVDEVAAAR
jgi:Icc-related predicted phosphoesterase